MTTTLPPANNPSINAAQSATAASSSPSGTTSPLAAGSAQPTARSYASATKKQFTPPPTASSNTTPLAVGGSVQPQHGKNNSVSPVNGKPSIPPAVPAVNAPTIVSSANGGPADHSRKPSMTISAAGTSINNTNGGPATPAARPNINFGSMNAGGSPAVTHTTPHQSQAASVPAPNNPRIQSPAVSPSPIPQPASTSGGRPPSSLQGQSNGPLVFGSQGGESMDQGNRPNALPQGAPQAQHLRRESSQSAHSDSQMNRGYPPNGGRGGRGGFQQGYGGPAHSPVPAYRQPHNQQRPHPGAQYPSSPYQATRSPHLSQARPQHAQPFQNPGVQNFAYPQHLQAQGLYGMPQQYDPTYGYYHQQQYMHPGMQFQNGPPPGSPRPGYVPHQQPYLQGQYNVSHAQNMQRTPSSSQQIERPPSTLAAPQTPALSAANHNHTPSQGSASPAPSSNFTIPAKTKSKGIVIKNAEGEVVTFDKKSASPAPSSTGPVVVSSSPTPPPHVVSTPGAQHVRTESKSIKSDAEKKTEFQEQVKRQLEAEKVEEIRRKEAKESGEKKAAQDKAEAEAKAAKEKEEAETKAAKEKEKAEAKAAKEKEEAAKAEAEAAKAKEDEEAKKAAAAEKERLEKEEEERMIAEMEEMERLEEEHEKAFQEKQAQKKAEQAKKDAEAKAKEDEELKRLEREAEEREERKANSKTAEEDSALFASLKKPTLGPGATAAASESGTSTPTSTTATEMPPPSQPKSTISSKPKPAALKLETNKPVEPAQPTAGMQSLKSARFLQVRNEIVTYPGNIKSPNPALNQGGKSKGRQYDKDFLLQFQEVFKEKPSVDWDSKLKETVGDGSDSARPQSARPSGMDRRVSSQRGGVTGMGNPVMGQFGSGSAGPGGRTLPPGTTSSDRFNASLSRPMTTNNPLAQFVGANRPASNFPMGGTGMARQASFGGPNAQPNSPRNNSHRGSKRGPRNDRQPSKREEEQAAKAMPLTAGLDLKPLEVSKTGWKPTSLGPAAAQPQMQAGGLMAPEMVQRKVKSNLNKMTPENFDKISGQILEIAGQSVHETDGRTLRQVIQWTFEKACDEAHWASMYAKFAKRMLQTMSSEIKDDKVLDKTGAPVVGGALFRKYLLNRCQEDFERGWEANLPDKPEGEAAESKDKEAVMLSDEYYIAAAAKRRGLGLIQFIGELYKLNMLTLRIMHECVMRLLNFEGLPDESSIESLVKLLRTIGATMDADIQGSQMITVYFERISKVMAMEALPSRLRFMLLDVIDLRKQAWKSKDANKGPKTIQEIRAEAAAATAAADLERQRQNQRGGHRMPMGRGDARSASGGMPPPDYNRNQIGMDDLRKLSKNAASRTNSQSPAAFGPSSLFAGRTSSGRRGIGGSALGRPGEDSATSSRTGTPPVKEKDTTPHTNSFSALASLNAQDEEANDAASNPSASPPVNKSQPARAQTSSPGGETAKLSE